MRRHGRTRHVTLMVLLAVALGVIAMLLVWEAQHESTVAIEGLSSAQATLAHALAMDLQHRIETTRTPDGAPDVEAAVASLLRDSEGLGAERATLLLVRQGERWWGVPGPLAPTVRSLSAGARAREVFEPPQAVELGLPKAAAVAAWEPLLSGRPGVLVIASARTELARAERETLLSIAAVLVVLVLVLAFGITAVRRDAERVELHDALRSLDAELSPALATLQERLGALQQRGAPADEVLTLQQELDGLRRVLARRSRR